MSWYLFCFVFFFLNEGLGPSWKKKLISLLSYTWFFKGYEGRDYHPCPTTTLSGSDRDSNAEDCGAICDQSGSEVRLVVSTFITLIQYVYINRSSTDGRSTCWRQMSLAHEQMRNDKTFFQWFFFNWTGLAGTCRWPSSLIHLWLHRDVDFLT